ncbi:MAG: SMI1/KNR4 family protein [Streptosporangiaceae bacterium]
MVEQRLAGATVDQDEVFEAVRATVAAGEYVDWVPAIKTQGPRGAGGTEPVRNAPGGCGYVRGTPEHVQTRTMGLVARLPPPPVALPEAVLELEEAIGCSLPPLLRRLFLEVANGGFGPSEGGILGVRGYGLTHTGNWTDLLHAYRAFSPHVPREMLWLYDWGCAIWSLVDCSRPEGQMWVWDPNGAEDPSPANSLFREAMTLTDWLAAWLHGELDLPQIADDEIPGQLTLLDDMQVRPLS